MENGYIEVRRKRWNNWLDNSPVQINEWRLFADRETAEYYIQFVMRNSGDDDISGIRLTIALCDDEGEKFQVVPYEYKRIKLVKRKIFGEEHYIPVGSRKPGKIKLAINEVKYTNQRSWSEYKAISRVVLPKQEKIEDLDEEERQSIRDTIKAEHIMFVPERFMYLPIMEKGFWMCTCGQANEAAESTCINCTMDREWVFEHININQ